MDFIADLLTITGRILSILPLALAVVLFMGRRSIGELPVFDYLIIITLGAVIGADIAEPDINHIYTAYAIIVIGLLQKLFATLTLKSGWLKNLTRFETVLVIRDGIFLVKNLRKINYSLDNILEMLREQGIFNVADVTLAFVEGNGKLSIYKRTELAAATRQDLGLVKPVADIAYPVIIEGKILPRALVELRRSESWLQEQLQQQGIDSVSQIFFAAVDETGQLHISPHNS
ncbi:MAG: DUF421 domain-containing protein [Sporomusaceae bacterium]|nr:DUF421 domain-containing protein [Sporomusaceae bacterium]